MNAREAVGMYEDRRDLTQEEKWLNDYKALILIVATRIQEK